MNPRGVLRFFAPSLCSLLIAGCGRGPGLIPVEGTVLLDGSPVAEAGVMVVPANARGATGNTDAQGHFQLTTTTPGDGVPPGTHKVSVVKKKVSGLFADSEGLSGVMDSAKYKEEWLTPPRYADPATSGLTIEVRPGMKPVTLELKSK